MSKDNHEPDHDYVDHFRQSGWKAHAQLTIVILFIISVFAASQFVQIGGSAPASAPEARPLLVETVKVQPQSQEVTFTRTGTVELNGRINIIPQVSGRVVFVHENFSDGGTFKAHEELFRIEQDDFLNQVDIARAEVERAQTELLIQEAESQAAEEEWKSLNPDKDVPPLVARKPQLDQARAALKAAKARLSDAELALQRTVFTYPFDGRVIETDIEVGQFLQAGQPAGQVYSKNSLEVHVPVEDRILRFLDPATTSAHIKTDYRGQELKLTGHIERIGSVLEDRTRFVDLIIAPRDQYWDKLVPGVFTEVTLAGERMDNLWRLPNETLQGQQAVWIIDEDDRLRYFEPTILSIHKTHTLAMGNAQPVRLVKGLLKGGSEGMKVRISQEAQESNNTSKNTDILKPAAAGQAQPTNKQAQEK